MPNVFRFRSLKDSAKKVQSEMTEGIDIEKFAKPGQKEEARRKYEQAVLAAKNQVITPEDVVRYLLYVGIDLKGQIQMAFDAKGFGGSAEVSVNPFGLVGLNTEVGAGGSLKGAKQRTVIVSRGPGEITYDQVNHLIPMPIIINSLIGKYWQAKVQLSLDVSVGFEAQAGVTPKKGDLQAKSKTESSIDDDFGKKDDEEGITGFEAVGVSASAKAGLKAEAGYTYDHFYAEDVYPLNFSDDQKHNLHKRLEIILAEGSIKTMFKHDACEFINANVAHFGGKGINLHGKFLWHTTTKGHKDIIKKLEQCSTGAPRDVKHKAYLLARKLSRFSTKGDSSSYLRLSSHKPEGTAGLYAKGEANASASALASVGVSAEAFAGVSGSYKKAYARFQSKVHTQPYKKDPRGRIKTDTIYTTYDTVITYSSFYLGFDFGVDAEFNLIGGFGASLSEDTPLGDKLEKTMEKAKWRPDALNQISYRTAIATWKKPDPFAKNTKPSPGKTVPDKTNSLRGTGVAYGQSFVVANLAKLIKTYYNWTTGRWNADVKNDSYVKIISNALNLPNSDGLLEFLRNNDVLTNIAFYLPLDVGVLIEATYRVNNSPVLDINRAIDKDTGKELVQLDGNIGKTLFKSNHTLESIRLRYRKRDVHDKDSTLFTVGFKVQGTAAKIKLERVDRAGADGIFDVATVFIDNDLKAIERSNAQNAYERAVPPAALFCQ